MLLRLLTLKATGIAAAQASWEADYANTKWSAAKHHRSAKSNVDSSKSTTGSVNVWIEGLKRFLVGGGTLSGVAVQDGEKSLWNKSHNLSSELQRFFSLFVQVVISWPVLPPQYSLTHFCVATPKPSMHWWNLALSSYSSKSFYLVRRTWMSKDIIVYHTEMSDVSTKE